MDDSPKTKAQLIGELDNYRTLFENTPLGYHSLNEAGDIIEVNGSWCRVLGYSKEEVLGRNFSEFLRPDFQKRFQQSFPKFKERGSVSCVEKKPLSSSKSQQRIL